MKKIYIVFLLVWTTVMGCHRVDPTLDNEQGKAVTLQWNIVQSPIVQTKAPQQTAAETWVDNLWVFAFSEDKLVQVCQPELIDNSTSKAQVKLEPSAAQLDLFVVANAGQAQEATFNSFVIGTTTVADLKALQTDLAALIGPNSLPMWGEALGQTINSSTPPISLVLTRSCAKIVVDNKVADFTFGGVVKLLHTNNGATLFPSTNPPATATTISDVVPTELNLSSIYLYEQKISATAEQTLENEAVAVVIKGTYKGIEGYYKLRLYYTSGANTAHDVNRNTVYSFEIRAVQAPGFVDLAQAEANYPQNVQYIVSSTNENDYDYDLTVSNGQYSLGVTNSEYVVYASGVQTGLHIATWSHDIPDGATISDGTITATTGIALAASSTTIPVAPNAAGFKTGDIVVDLDAAFKSGSITLRLGNLIKVIPISRKAELTWLSQVCTDFNTSEYVASEVTSGYSWLKLGSDIKNYSDNRKLTSLTGGVWLHVVDPPQTTTDRGTVFLSRANGKGRIKAEIALTYPQFNGHDGWAGSNIYWNGTQLTFDNYGVTLNERYMGVYFQWGSLVALSTSWTTWGESSILFAPGTMDQNGAPWTAAIGGTAYNKIPTPAVTEKNPMIALRHNLLEVHNPERNIGDICKWMTDKGWAPTTPSGKGWRMPTMGEFNSQGLKSARACPFEGAFTAAPSAAAAGTMNVASGVRTIKPHAGAFFPAGGQLIFNKRSQIYTTESQGNIGHYWSASVYTSILYSYSVLISSTNVQSYPGNSSDPTAAKAVRCVRVK